MLLQGFSALHAYRNRHLLHVLFALAGRDDDLFDLVPTRAVCGHLLTRLCPSVLRGQTARRRPCQQDSLKTQLPMSHRFPLRDALLRPVRSEARERSVISEIQQPCNFEVKGASHAKGAPSSSPVTFRRDSTGRCVWHSKHCRLHLISTRPNLRGFKELEAGHRAGEVYG